MLCREINRVIREHGLDGYDKLAGKAFSVSILDKINAVHESSRPFDSVGSMMRRRKGPIADLIQRGKDVKAQLDAGETLSKEERYAKEALRIPTTSGTAEDEDGEKGDIQQEEPQGNQEEDMAGDTELAKAIHLSEKEYDKRERDDEAEETSEDEVKAGRGRKRQHSRAEEDARQAAAKAFVPPSGDDEDDNIFAVLR